MFWVPKALIHQQMNGCDVAHCFGGLPIVRCFKSAINDVVIVCQQPLRPQKTSQVVYIKILKIKTWVSWCFFVGEVYTLRRFSESFRGHKNIRKLLMLRHLS
jgi:hypothetical protein